MMESEITIRFNILRGTQTQLGKCKKMAPERDSGKKIISTGLIYFCLTLILVPHRHFASKILLRVPSPSKLTQSTLITSCVSGRGHRIGAVCECMCVCVSTLTAKPFDP